jgi:GT2 family glycosyltransferase
MKKEYDFSFVILNYITTYDSIECVKSIKKYCDGYKYHIVIIDNASPNNSGKELKDIFKKDNYVEVILLSENVGFAKGNNVGFKYAKKEFNSDFIVLCNSDTELLSFDFCSNIIKKYENEKFAVLGPKEKLVGGDYYPLTASGRSINKLKFDIRYYESILYQNKLKNFYRLYSKFYGILSKKNLDVNREYWDIILHGAFLIFSKEYIDLFDGLNPITYFYGEEEFLALRLKKYGLHSIYYPEIEILHKRNSATNASTKSEEEKKKFTLSCHIDSTKKLLAAVKGEIEL